MSSERADIHSVPARSDCALFRFPAPEFPDRNTGMSAEKTAQVILIQQPHERTGLFQGQPAHPHQLTDPFHFQPVEIGDQALSRVPFEDRTQISRTDV